MGRKSRQKHERRERNDGPVVALVAQFSTQSVVPLLEAASVSPTAAHRGPSIASLFHGVTQCKKPGAKSAAPDALPALVAGVQAASPAIATSEDFRPYDGRSEVLVRWGPALLRLLPGSLERPSAMVDQHLLLARVIDRVLVPRLGFGVFDVGDLVLRRIDHVARSLAPIWPDGPAAEIGDEPHVTRAEVNAAAGLRSLNDVVGECVNPSRASAAAARYTMTRRGLACDIAHPIATFGTAIATRIGSAAVPLPAAFLIEALPAIGAELATLASSADPTAEDFYAGTVGNRIGRLFQGSGHSIAGPIRAGGNDPIHSLVTVNGRQILAIDVATGLTASAIQDRLDRGAQALAEIQPGMEVSNPGAAWRLPVDAEIARVQVIAGPLRAVPLKRSGPVMTLEDLQWIVHSAQRSREDLWYFVRDLENPPAGGSMFAWDLIDKWEVWQEQKSFYRGGISLTTLLFSPHAAVAEWEAAAAAAPTERALHALELPPLRDWPIVDLDHHQGSELGDIRTDQIFQIMSWTVPVAVAKSDPACPQEQHRTLWSLADGITWKLEHSAEAFLEAAKRSGLRSLRITFAFQERDAGPPLTSESFVGEALAIGWDRRLQDALLNDSFAVESLCGELLSHAFAPSIRDQFIAAWDAAPPGVRIDEFAVRQRVQHLPEPLEVHDALRSDLLRQLGEYLSASEIEPKLFEGAEATSFESNTVFPWLLAKFHETISGFSAEELLNFALVQLESAHHQRFMIDKRLAWHSGFPVRHENRDSDPREPIARMTRVISFIVEEVLAHPPPGHGHVDDLAWIGALSIADVCIESCFRSDAIHYRLARTSVELTDLFEVKVVSSDEPTDFDMQGYGELRSLSTAPAAEPIATGQDRDLDSSDDDPRPLLDLMPTLADIDGQMRSSLGFGLDAITELLHVATQWDATASEPAVLASSGAIVDQCVALAVGATREEYRAALDWLTLRGDDLAAEPIPHWETERRAKRVITSPFVCTVDGVWVLPWTAESTLRIVANYLSDGRLPWPGHVLPREVSRALDHYRQRQNKELEKECVAALDEDGFVVRGSIKPEKAGHYGIPNLTGEIDALCVDASRSRIWVIEAKDPYTPYSSRQIRRLVNDFNDPGKYVDQLLRKVADIAACASSVAAALGVSDPSRCWVVAGLMVTRHLEPAALAVAPKVPFCVIDDVMAVVNNDALPAPGLHGPTVGR
jgi:hypothetical protein